MAKRTAARPSIIRRCVRPAILRFACWKFTASPPNKCRRAHNESNFIDASHTRINTHLTHDLTLHTCAWSTILRTSNSLRTGGKDVVLLTRLVTCIIRVGDGRVVQRVARCIYDVLNSNEYENNNIYYSYLYIHAEMCNERFYFVCAAMQNANRLDNLVMSLQMAIVSEEEIESFNSKLN